MLVTTTFTGDGPHLASFRPKSFAAEESGGGPAEVVDVAIPELGATGAATIDAVHVEESTGPRLDEAAIVVSGGRGLGEAANYQMIEDLAKLLKGAPGASRAIVDAGWVPYSYQVGQTGKVVKPTVYIAAGISGATQHMVGMKGAKNIIAINKDKEAPIFGIADLGIVGDVHKVLPKLIEALQAAEPISRSAPDALVSLKPARCHAGRSSKLPARPTTRERAPDQRRHPLGIEPAELVPLGQHRERRPRPRRPRRRRGRPRCRQLPPHRGVEGRDASALQAHRLGDGQRRRVAEVVGAGLERQAPHGDA